MNDKPKAVFPNGVHARKPHAGAPSYVIADVGIDPDKFIAWLSAWKADHAPGTWLHLDVKEASSGKWYTQVNTFVPKPKGSHDGDGGAAAYGRLSGSSAAYRAPEPEPEPFVDDDLPF